MAARIGRRSATRRKLARGILWGVIIALAFGLRVVPIRAAWPYVRYIDEGHIVHHAIDLLQKGTLDTGLYIYPSLPSYMIAGAIAAYAPYYTHKHGRDFWAELRASSEAGFYDCISPPRILVLARSIVLLFSVGTVVLSGVLGRMLGGARAGLLALLLAALCPALVSRSAIAMVDPVATFFATACLCLCQQVRARAVENPAAGARVAVLAGAAAGLALTSKYMAGAVFVAVIAAIFLTRVTPKAKLPLLAWSGVGFVVATIVTMPALALHPAKVLGTVLGIAGYYNTISYGTSYWRDALSFRELGLPLILCAIGGFGLLWQRSRVTRAAAISWLAFALVLIGGLAHASFQPFRNLLPLAPAVCVAAAFLLARGDLWFTKPSTRKVVNDWVEPVIAFVVMLSLAVPAWREVEQQRAVVDTRVRMLDWLRQHAAPNERIVALRELAIHPAEWRRIGRKANVVSWFDVTEVVASGAFDYLITSDFSLQFASDKDAWARHRELWSSQVGRFPVVAEFGSVSCPVDPGVWRTNDEKLLILRATTP